MKRCLSLLVIEVRDRDDCRVPNTVVRFAIRKTIRNPLAAMFQNGQGEGEIRTLPDASGRASAGTLSPVEAGSVDVPDAQRHDHPESGGNFHVDDCVASVARPS
jgi:hypothetical protein